MDKPALDALSEKATAGEWHLMTGAIGCNPWISVSNWTRPDGSYVRGGCILNMVAHDEREQDAAFIVALVNAYRTGHLTVADPQAIAAAEARGFERGVKAAWEKARGTNADMCKTPRAAYMLIVSALRAMWDKGSLPAITQRNRRT